MAGQDWFEKDFYAVLGVSSDATQDQVKKAYRKLARQYHPDANAGDLASERRFKEIGEAYGVLSDEEQRRQYDAVRAMSRGGARFSAGGAGAGPGGFEDLLGGLFTGSPQGGRGNVRFSTSGGPAGATPDLDDLFTMFGGGAAGPGAQTGFRAPRAPRRGRELAAEGTLTFQQAVDGALLSLRIDDGRSGVRTVNARIPAGVREGQKVRIRGRGGPADPGGEPGDLVVTVHVESHPIFELAGEDLKITLPVTFTEAALGAQIDVPTLDGGTVRVKVPSGTPSGRTLRVKGHGVKGPRRTGDLLVGVQVVVPQKLDSHARDALQAFAEATAGEDPRRDLLERAARGAPAGNGSRDGR